MYLQKTRVGIVGVFEIENVDNKCEYLVKILSTEYLPHFHNVKESFHILKPLNVTCILNAAPSPHTMIRISKSQDVHTHLLQVYYIWFDKTYILF